MLDIVRYGVFRDVDVDDLCNLRLVCKTFCGCIGKQELENSICNVINEKFYSTFYDGFSEFKKLLNDTGAVISGDFILEAILGKLDIDVNIEIYIFDKKYLDALESFMKKMEFQQNIKYFNISQFITMRQHNIHINHKYLNIDELKKNINTLNICKNYYWCKDGKDYIEIFKLKDIITRSTNFNFDERIYECVWSHHKYSTLDFVFKNIPDKQIVFEIMDIGNNKFTILDNENGIDNVREIDLDSNKIRLGTIYYRDVKYKTENFKKFYIWNNSFLDFLFMIKD